MVSTPVDVDFLNSEAAQSLTQFVQAGGATHYAPRDGQDPMGPIRGLDEFVREHIPPGTIDTAFLCDPGTDDFMTGMLALDYRSRLRPFLVVPSFGNVSGTTTYNNALTMVSLMGAFGVAVGKGAQKPLRGPMPEDASGEHGADGLNGAKPKNADEVKNNIGLIKQHEDGIQVLADDIVRRYMNKGRPVLILSTGSMTDVYNLITAIENENPEAMQKIAGISLMGGGIDTGRWHTNMSDYAEFNIFQDPLAAQESFRMIHNYRIPTIVFPLDLTHTTGVRQNHEGAWLKQHAELTGNNVSDMAAQIYKAGGFDVTRSLERFGFPEDKVTRFMHDPNVVTGIDKPRLYQGFNATVNVITDGAEKGQTVVRPSLRSRTFVVVKGDAAEIIGDWQKKISTYRVHPELAHAPK